MYIGILKFAPILAWKGERQYSSKNSTYFKAHITLVLGEQKVRNLHPDAKYKWFEWKKCPELEDDVIYILNLNKKKTISFIWKFVFWLHQQYWKLIKVLRSYKVKISVT